MIFNSSLYSFCYSKDKQKISGTGNINGVGYRVVPEENLKLLGEPQKIKSLAELKLEQSDELKSSLYAIYKSIVTGRKIFVEDLSEAPEF